MTFPMPWVPKMAGPRTRRMADARFHQLLYFISCEGDDFLEEAKRAVSDAWLTLEMDVETDTAKQKISLYLDQSLVKM